MNCKKKEKTCLTQADKTPFDSLKAAVDEFNIYAKEQVDRELFHYSKDKNTYEQTIEKAGDFEDEYGNKHSHQWRIKHSAAQKLKNELALICKDDFENFETFDELLKFIDQKLRKIPGIGDLAIYDTATRLGAYFELSPNIVYLHAGTLEGAKKLLGKQVSKKKYLTRNELPQAFRKLTPDQIENLLCIYKDRLHSKLAKKT